MTLNLTDQTIANYLTERGDLWPPTALDIAEHTGIPLSTVYVSLRALHATRTRRAKNEFGYVLPDEKPLTFPSAIEHPGTINGRPWRHVADMVMRAVADVALTDKLTARQYAEGFEIVGRRFLELAAHADAVKDQPDWKITLGFHTDTERETNA